MNVNIPFNDSSIVYSCPSELYRGGWSPSSATIVSTDGNGCYMEYSFTADAIAIEISQNFDHAVFGCSLDGSLVQWFSANEVPNEYHLGCGVSGLGTTQQHTIRLTHQPVPGWGMTLTGISVNNTPSTTTSGSAPTISSFYHPYNMPEALVSTTEPTSTPIVPCSVRSVRISPAVTGGVAGALGFLAFLCWFLVWYLWRKGGEAPPALPASALGPPMMPEGASQKSH